MSRFGIALFVLGVCAASAEQSPIVINEIMYHAPGDLENLQYIELFNAGKSARDLSGWSFSKGAKFVFPKGTELASGAYLVVCRDRAEFARRYGKEVTLAGEFKGHLSRNGELVELSDAGEKVVDAVIYKDSAPWPAAADGHSASLERICPLAPGDDASNWAASNLPEFERPSGTPGRINDSYSSSPPPVIDAITLTPLAPKAGEKTTVHAEVADADGVKGVEVIFQVVAPRSVSVAQALPMKRVSGDAQKSHYEAVLPGQPEDRLVRYRIQAIDEAGAKRASPGANDLRGAWTYSTFTSKNSAKVPFGFLLRAGDETNRAHHSGRSNPTRCRGQDAFIYVPAGGGDVQVFDFVQTPPRKGGYKVHFHKDQTLRGMTGINIIFEESPRYALTEALSYELFRLAGVPAALNEHIRLSVDGQWQGYHLLIEQPNKAFLARNKRDTNGNLYKLIWYENGLVGKHEKKTNLSGNHDDLIAAVRGLSKTDPREQWDFIKQHFNVEEFINYFAVNMCIQNWDGFHNNYFVYHDTGASGLWEIYPWDEDKTWGDYDGASPRYNWYQLPLSYAANGDQPPGGPRARDSFAGWWRPPGFFSGPLLANPEFRQRFRARLREICATIFTQEKVFPLIDAMESRLGEEVVNRAKSHNQDPREAVARFRSDLQSLREQVINRRKFILAELDKLQR